MTSSLPMFPDAPVMDAPKPTRARRVRCVRERAHADDAMFPSAPHAKYREARNTYRAITMLRKRGVRVYRVSGNQHRTGTDGDILVTSRELIALAADVERFTAKPDQYPDPDMPAFLRRWQPERTAG